MNKVVMTIIVFQLVAGGVLCSQTIESGSVKYQKLVPLRAQLGDEWIGYKDQVSKTAAFNYILYFSTGESLFSENSKENAAPSPSFLVMIPLQP